MALAMRKDMSQDGTVSKGVCQEERKTLPNLLVCIVHRCHARRIAGQRWGPGVEQETTHFGAITHRRPVEGRGAPRVSTGDVDTRYAEQYVDGFHAGMRKRRHDHEPVPALAACHMQRRTARPVAYIR